MKKITIYLLVIISLFPLLISCNSLKNTEANIDENYKIFWGEWKVTNVIKPHKGESIDHLSDQHITFLKNKIKVYGKFLEEKPVYTYNISPVDLFDSDILEKVKFTGNYFVEFHLGVTLDSEKCELRNCYYLIIDEQTLIAYTPDAALKLERVSYADYYGNDLTDHPFWKDS